MNVVIKRRVAAHNIDALNRSFIAAEDVENGSIFVLNSRFTNETGDEVWKAEKPTADSLGVWMAKSSEVVLVKIGDGTDAEVLNMKGIVEDPRMFTNVAGFTGDCFKPQVGDVIEMTQGDDTNKYLIADTTFKLKSATAAGTGFAMHEIDTGILHIGSAKLVKTPVKTHIYQVVAN